MIPRTRVGLIGYGRRGAVLLRLLRGLPRVDVVGVGDFDSAARERAAVETGLPTFDSRTELWPPGAVDVAVVATPVAGRSFLIERVADTRVRAILAEKPLALTLSEADWVVTACQSRGVQFSLGQHFRFCPDLVQLKELIASGALGRIESIQATGVGSLMDQGWHLLDAARWLLGGPRVLWSAAQATSDRDLLARLGERLVPAGGDPNHPGPAWVSAQMALEGDVRFWLETGPLSQRTGAALGDWHERRLRVQGTHGSAECRPGHYLRVWGAAQTTRELDLDPASLDAATVEMLAAVCQSAANGNPVPNSAEDARHTLEGLLLCVESLQRQSVATAPLSVADDPLARLESEPHPATIRLRPPAGATAPDAPRFSVIIPLIEDRGMVDACLQGWLQQEAFPAAGYELLLVNDGTRDEMAARLAPRLRPHDWCLREADVSRSGLYDLGARAARGEFIVLTESHCVPEPDFLRELDRYFRHSDVDGACCRTIPVCHNNLSRADAAAFASGFDQFRRDGDWRKVNVHGFALRREQYERAGGLPARYGLFAEMVLAARLRDDGVRLGYCSGAAVNHHYRATLQEIVDFADDFARGELLYRLDHGSSRDVGFSYMAPDTLLTESTSGLWTCLQSEWRRLCAGAGRGDLSALPDVWSLTARLQRAGFSARVQAALALKYALLRCWLSRWSLARLTRNYERLFYASVKRAWIRHASIGLQDVLPLREERVLSLSEIPSDWLIGFHPAEPGDGRSFRWSSTAAGIDLPLPAGDYQLTINCGGIRPWPASLRWTINGREIPADDVEYTRDCCRLRVRLDERRRAARCTLGWQCLPWDVSDPRRLGLPVYEIECRSIPEREVARSQDAASLPFPDLRSQSARRAA